MHTHVSLMFTWSFMSQLVSLFVNLSFIAYATRCGACCRLFDIWVCCDCSVVMFPFQFHSHSLFRVHVALQSLHCSILHCMGLVKQFHVTYFIWTRLYFIVLLLCVAYFKGFNHSHTVHSKSGVRGAYSLNSYSSCECK